MFPSLPLCITPTHRGHDATEHGSIMNKLQRNVLRRAGPLPLLAALLPACWLVGAARPAAAAGVYTVTSTFDDGSSGTLRSAISLANADPGATVVFSPGLSGTISLQGAEIDLSASMTIVGPGAGVVALDGGGALRLFNITSPTAQVALSGLALQNGSASGDPNGATAGAGGALYNAGALTLTGCAFFNNTGSFGGAVYNSAGALALTGCIFTSNTVGDTGGGGAVYNDSGVLALTGCTLSFDNASYAGGLYNGGTATLTACTISSCVATGTSDGGGGAGAGLYNDGTLTLAACLIRGDLAFSGSGGAGGAGGGLYSDGTLMLTGCTLNGNAVGPDAGDGSKTGGGLDNQGAATLTDDIFYADSLPEITSDTSLNPSAAVTASYCDIQGSSAGAGGIGPNVSFGANVFDADPLFVRVKFTQGPNDPGDLHLQAGSPCVGVGVANAANAMDLDGNPRPAPPSIGAYEYPLGPPVPNPQNVSIQQDTPVAITLTGSDPAGLPLTYRVASGPAHGTLTGTAPNLFYTPNAGYTGADSFTFAVSNGFLARTATVSIAVVPNHAVDVSGQVSVRRGGYLFNRRRNLLQQVIALTNTGPALAGPVVVAFDGLPSGVAVFRPDGTTQAALPAGSPYLVAVPAGGTLASGASVSVPVSFYDPVHVPAPYTPRILAGNAD